MNFQRSPRPEVPIDVSGEVPQKAGLSPVKRLQTLIPGLITGTGDVDPSFVVTATVIGAAYQFSLLWLVLLCIPILITIFDVSARIGHETHQGLVELLREQYGMWLGVVCAVLIVLINMAMIVADSVAVTDAMSIVLGEKRQVFIVLVSFVVWYILIFRDYRRIVRFMVWAAMPLFAYVVSAVISGPDLKILAQGVLFPRVAPTPDYAAAILGIFGSLLTPYLLVWQTSSRREMATHGPVQMGSAEHRFGGMITILLSFCIIVSAASVLHLTSPTDMSTSDAAKALTPAVGGLGSILFAVGIIGSGFVALPILVASMCYSVAEAFGWNYGLSEHPWEAKRFYVMISFSMLFAAAANLVGVNPVKLLYLSQVLAGVLAIPILVFILLLSNDRRVMRTTNSRWQNFWIGAASGGLLATGGMVLFLKLFT